MRDEVVELARALVRAPSPNPPGDERGPAGVLTEYLADLSPRLIGTREERPTLVAAVGEGPPALALSAHLDTHAVTAGWTLDPFEGGLDGGRLYGLGSTDVKGAVAAAAVAFRELAAERLGGRLLLIANADEETGGRYGIEVVRDLLGEKLSGVVVAEPSGIDEPWARLWTGARGTSRFRLRARGTDTHSSLADHDGVGSAIETLEQAVARLRSGLGTGARTIPVEIAGGTGWGVVPSTASVAVEVRVSPPADRQRVEARVHAALADLPVELEFAEGSLRWMAPSAVDPDDPLVAAARAAWREVIGDEPRLGCFPGGTDARLYAERGIPTVIAGPGALVRAHRPDEYVTVDELETAARLYAAIARRYLAG